MKTIWSVKTCMMNGTVTMMTIVDSFVTKELAEKAAKAITEKNKGSEFPVIVSISESKLFESLEEVPILN